MVVLILLHSAPYDAVTGVKGEKTFENYLSYAKKKGYAVDYITLKFDVRNIQGSPKEFGKMMHSFWNWYFKDVLFFALKKGVYVLVIPRNMQNGDTKKSIHRLIDEEFPNYFSRGNMQYRILALLDLKHIKKADEIGAIINYCFDIMDQNQSMVANEELMKRIQVMRNVLNEMEDIEKKHDLLDERVLVYCQPIKNVRTGRYDTAEALMRLKIGTEMIFPAIFIPLAEKYGFIHTLSLIILNKVCKQMKKMLDHGYEFQRISVNFSMLEMRKDTFCDEILTIIEKNQIPYDKIGIEITESQNDQDYYYLYETISMLKKHDIKIYLDDFGTGYSNFERILRLGFDVIKFDRSFLLYADSDQKGSYILEHFSKAFTELGYTVLCEGIETEEQESMCLHCGVNYLQGYKFSKPIPMEQLIQFFVKS